MKMSEAQNPFHPTDEPDYAVELPPEDYLIVVAGTRFNSPAARFQHPNVAAKQNTVHEFKHYRKNGSKFWTEQAGVDFFFIVPKSQIYLVKEKGFSYVPVIINGEKFSLNVSAVGSSNWTDFVRQYAHLGCGCKRKTLKKLAEVAITPQNVKIREQSHFNKSLFVELATKQLHLPNLNQGHKIVLDGASINQSKGPFEIKSREIDRKGRKLRTWIVLCPGFPSRYQVPAKFIDWTETAKANGFPLPG
jgi:hypothetical protein